MSETGSRLTSGVAMAVGLGLVGLAGYVLLAVAGNTLPPADVATVASVYLLLNILGPGLYVALEQETSRAVAARPGAELVPTVRTAALVGAALVATASVVLAATSPVLVPRVLGGHWGLLGVLVLSTAAAAGLFLLRGVLGGRRRFSAYAGTLGAEGGGRLAVVLAVAGLGAASATGYGLAFMAGYALALVVALPWVWPRRSPRPARSGGGEPARTLARGVTLLGVATLLSFAVANIAPVVVTGRLPGEPAVAAAFAQAFVLARAPMLVFAPVQAMLLPGLTTAAERGALDLMRTRVRQILLAVTAVGVPGAIAAAVFGPWVLRTFFGVGEPPSPAVLGLLGGGTVLLMAAQTLQPALVALRRHRTVTTAWTLGTVLLAGLLALPVHAVAAALIAQLAGSVVVASGCLLGLRSELRRRALVDAREC
ncbi:lipopolysaccharide biosynthesis protein [Qaidamihabitans albus]|uniref:lipopolysaccharide biosynthesis protein n=1 Tax=Qaidamihabitans albus TaxID=2795733 RepID=UPI0018F1EC3A|nr:lipopolysaccharide biosynthesis protein [Qaidamihabitans albus]